MSQQIVTQFVQQYSTNISMLVQQKDSRLSGAVMVQSFVGKQASPVDQIGAVTATKRTTRYPSLTPQDTPTDRRWVLPTDYDWNDLIDNVDKLRMLVDPQSSYAQNGSAAMQRAKDDEIIAAFFGTAKTGEQGATSTTFPASQQVSASFEAASATGLTVAKLRRAKRILIANEVDVMSDTLYCAISAAQHDDLMREAQVIDLDYTDRPVLVEGMVTRFLGINFIHSERLPTNGSSQRRCPVWAKSGMCLGTWADVAVDVSQRKDLAGLPWQVYTTITAGGTRLEEKKVVEIPCVES